MWKIRLKVESSDFQPAVLLPCQFDVPQQRGLFKPRFAVILPHRTVIYLLFHHIWMFSIWKSVENDRKLLKKAFFWKSIFFWIWRKLSIYFGFNVPQLLYTIGQSYICYFIIFVCLGYENQLKSIEKSSIMRFFE